MHCQPLASPQGLFDGGLPGDDNLRAEPRIISLALYLPNGDFIKEDAVGEHTHVLHYIHDLENGHRGPRFRLPDSVDGSMLGYVLLWGEATLDKKFNFGDFVDAHSISRPAAVDITVVTVESPLRYEGETFLQRQHNDYVENNMFNSLGGQFPFSLSPQVVDHSPR
jgi:hypothetical protein